MESSRLLMMSKTLVTRKDEDRLDLQEFEFIDSCPRSSHEDLSNDDDCHATFCRRDVAKQKGYVLLTMDLALEPLS